MITRPAADAGPLAARLGDLGVTSLLEPLLDVVNLPGPALDLTGVQALLITSANGARAFAARQGPEVLPRDLPVLAVGDASAREARGLGFERVQSAAGDVAALADLVRRRLDPGAGALLHVAGTRVAGDLAGLLAADGFAYRREVLYEARAAATLSTAGEAALRDGNVAGVAIFSPRTGVTFARLARAAGLGDALGRVTALCLSPAVADTISELPWGAVRIAVRPDQAALLDEIRALRDAS